MGAAVSSLPAYVQRSRFFLILAPPVAHANLPNTTLTFASWKERGWCRVERAARALAAADTQMLLVVSDAVVTVVHPSDYLSDSCAGTGIPNHVNVQDNGRTITGPSRITELRELNVCLEKHCFEGKFFKTFSKHVSKNK